MLQDHVWHDPVGRNAAISTEVTRVQTANGHIPVVAATRMDQIVLYNWRPGKKRWRANTIDHNKVLQQNDSPVRFTSPERDMFGILSRIGWCHRIGLASGLGYVFLVFKRELQTSVNLYVDVFRLSGDEDSLERVTPAPVPIPYGDGLYVNTGYYLWAGFSPADSSDPDSVDRLVILSQIATGTVAADALCYFSIEVSGDPDHYADPAAWTIRPVGDRAGGYDLDARLENGEIHCIYRQNEYPAAFSFTPSSSVDEHGALDVSDAAYAQLHYMRLRAQDGTELERKDNLPGGEHPQIQSVDPLAYTADRLSKGSVAMDLTANPPALRYDVTHSRKHLFLRANGDWATTRLMEFREDRLANSPMISDVSWGIADPILYIPDRALLLLQVARVQPLLPVFAARLDWQDDVLELDLVHHNRYLGALVMTRIRHDPLGHNFGTPNLNRYAILNINHMDIPNAWTTSPPTLSENVGFWPFDYKPFRDEGGAFQWTLRGAGQILNNTGGDLTMERLEGKERSIAFVHPGDGGVRILPDFDPTRINAAVNPSTQVHDPDAVTGDGRGMERTIVQHGDWMDFNPGLDRYFYNPGKTIFCGLDEQLHVLFANAHLGFLGTLSNGDHTVTLENDPSNALVSEAWDSLWAIWTQINDEVCTSSDLIESIGVLTLEISRFTITWETAPQKVIVTASPEFHIQYRFMGRNEGQGMIQSRFLTRIWVPSARLARWIAPLADASVEVNLDYRRSYSPAVLMDDTIRLRKREVVNGTMEISDEFDDRLDKTCATALTAKPVGSCGLLRPIDAETDFQWTVSGHALIWLIPLLAGLLGGLGLDWLATSLTGLAAKMAGEFASLIGIAAGITTYFILVGVLENVVPGEIEKAIVDRLMNYDFESILEDNQVHTHSGEGLADDIAWRALSESEREVQGLNRFKQGVFRMVYVTEKLCRVFREQE